MNERQIKAVDHVKENKIINLSSYKALIKNVSEKTLYRDLQDLVDKNILKEIGEKKAGNMNWHNGHLSDITDTFQTFIRHNHWHLIGDFGD